MWFVLSAYAWPKVTLNGCELCHWLPPSTNGCNPTPLACWHGLYDALFSGINVTTFLILIWLFTHLPPGSRRISLVVANSRKCAWVCFFSDFLKHILMPDLPLLLLMGRTLIIASFKMSVQSCQLWLLPDARAVAWHRVLLELIILLTSRTDNRFSLKQDVKTSPCVEMIYCRISIFPFLFIKGSLLSNGLIHCSKFSRHQACRLIQWVSRKKLIQA